MNIHYHATEPYEGYGLVIRLSEDEFLVSGYGINVSFNSKDRKRPGISYGTLREGYFVDGEWKTLKYLGDDEAMQGVGGVKMPSVYTDAGKVSRSYNDSNQQSYSGREMRICAQIPVNASVLKENRG